MNISRLVLVDGTEILLQEGSALGNIKVHYADREAMGADWDRLTVGNLKTIQVMTDDVVTAGYQDMILESETSVLRNDGSLDTVWNIREKTETEKLLERVAALEEGHEVLDGAVGDLGAVVSEMAGGEG